MPNFQYLSQHWDMYTYPWRPEGKNITHFEDVIKTGHKICILGATKELRQLCKKHKKVTHVYDTSDDMIRIGDVENSLEKIYNLDWFSIQEGGYDVILGDLILFLIPTEQQPQLLSVLQKNLTQGGKILLRQGGKLQAGNEKKFLESIREATIEKYEMNRILYECIIGLNYPLSQIVILLQQSNSLLYSFFEKNYIHLVPYSNTPPEDNGIGTIGREIYRKDFYTCYENIIEFTK